VIDLLHFFLQSPAPKTDAVTVSLGQGTRKPEDASAAHQISTPEAAQVTQLGPSSHGPSPSGSAEPWFSKTCLRAAVL